MGGRIVFAMPSLTTTFLQEAKKEDHTMNDNKESIVTELALQAEDLIGIPHPFFGHVEMDDELL